MRPKKSSFKQLFKRVAFYFFLLHGVYFMTGCDREENHPTDIIIANIDDVPVYEKEVDEKLKVKMEGMKRELLSSMIEERILTKEAKLRKMTVDSLLYLEVTKKASNVTSADFNRYIAQYKINTKKKHAVDIIQQIKQIKKDEKRLEYITQLKQKHRVSVSLFPSSFKTVKPDKLFYYETSLTKQNNIAVYIITDQTNPVCIFISPRLKAIVKKYEGQINFRYVINNQSQAISAINAANKQKKISEMHNFIFEKQPQSEKEFIRYAKQLNLDAKKFKKDIRDSQIAEKQAESAKELISIGITSTPAFIINNKLVNQTNSIDFLEALIQSELQNKK